MLNMLVMFILIVYNPLMKEKRSMHSSMYYYWCYSMLNLKFMKHLYRYLQYQYLKQNYYYQLCQHLKLYSFNSTLIKFPSLEIVIPMPIQAATVSPYLLILAATTLIAGTCFLATPNFMADKETQQREIDFNSHENPGELENENPSSQLENLQLENLLNQQIPTFHHQITDCPSIVTITATPTSLLLVIVKQFTVQPSLVTVIVTIVGLIFAVFAVVIVVVRIV